jgi:trehalose 6-phosphate phosphatase
VFVDFDGTLAPIVLDPASARPHPEAPAVLRSLADRWGVVAVVSGRPASFLAEHLAGGGATRFFGLYGLETADAASGRVDTRPEAERWRRAVAAAADEAEGQLGAGRVERKGLTVTLHYRREPAHSGRVEVLATDLAGRHGLEVHPAKMSVELRPPVGVDKGTVVRQLAAGLSAVAFAGDDVGDLPAFAVLRDLRAGGVATLAIASGGPETPPEVATAADVLVDGPDGIIEALRQL